LNDNRKNKADIIIDKNEETIGHPLLIRNSTFQAVGPFNGMNINFTSGRWMKVRIKQ